VRRDCPAAELWRFCPQKKLATVRNGAVEVTETVHYRKTFRFAVNGIVDGLYLPHGLRVAIAFHPGHPERGVHVQRRCHRAEPRRLADGDAVGTTCPLVHNVNLSDEPGEFGRKKKGTAAMRGEFRAIAQAGSAGRKVTTARDGTGNALVSAGSRAHAAGASLQPQASGLEPPTLSTAATSWSGAGQVREDGPRAARPSILFS